MPYLANKLNDTVQGTDKYIQFRKKSRLSNHLNTRDYLDIKRLNLDLDEINRKTEAATESLQQVHRLYTLARLNLPVKANVTIKSRKMLEPSTLHEKFNSFTTLKSLRSQITSILSQIRHQSGLLAFSVIENDDYEAVLSRTENINTKINNGVDLAYRMFQSIGQRNIPETFDIFVAAVHNKLCIKFYKKYKSTEKEFVVSSVSPEKLNWTAYLSFGQLKTTPVFEGFFVLNCHLDLTDGNMKFYATVTEKKDPAGYLNDSKIISKKKAITAATNNMLHCLKYDHNTVI